MLAAGDPTSPQASASLEELCRTYWYPLYVYVRRRGYGVEDAQDLTQTFFARVLEKKSFGLADPGRGRFRTFLLHALDHFLVNEWKRAHRFKRGGGTPNLSLDADEAEHRYAHEPSSAMTPERAFDRRWAMTLLEQVLASLRQEYAAAGNLRVFEELAELLRVPKSWLYSRTRTASLTGFSRLKLGRYVRFDKDEVIDWLRTNSSDDME